MNLISATTWLWKALRGHSVTFAVLLAAALLGISIVKCFKTALHAVGAPWLAGFLLPALLIGFLARHEATWWPEEARRKFWARSIVVGALLLAAIISTLKPGDGTAARAGKQELTPLHSPDKTPPALQPRGPSGK